MSGSEHGDIILWEGVPEPKEKVHVKFHEKWITDFTIIDKENKIIASASGDKTVKVIDLKNKKCIITLHHAEEVNAV